MAAQAEGDIFASHRKGHAAAERAVVHLNIRGKSDLRKMDKEALRVPFTDQIAAVSQSDIPKSRKKRKRR